MDRPTILNRIGFIQLVAILMREGDRCVWSFLDERNQRFVVFDSEEEARAGLSLLPRGNWRPMALHADNCAHVEREERLREMPNQVDRVMDIMGRILSDRNTP